MQEKTDSRRELDAYRAQELARMGMDLGTIFKTTGGYRQGVVDARQSAENKKRAKAVVITFGRFQPPTIGHEKLINAVIAHATKIGAEHRIYASQTFDGNRPRAAIKNPLQYKDKIRFMRQMFPKANIVSGDDDTNTFMRVLYELQKEGYQTVHVVVGDDRVSEIKNTVKQYLDSDDPETGLNFEDFKVVSAGKRDPEAEGVEGMSASKLRAAAAEDDFKLFKKGMPQGFGKARELFDAIKKGLERPMKPAKKKKGKVNEALVKEVAPPDDKSERFIKKSKASFKDRYGEDWASYLYGTAWRMYNDRMDAEDEDEDQSEVKENFDYGSYGYRIDPDGGKFILYVLSYSQGSVRFPDGRRGTVIGRFDSRQEAIEKAKKDAKSRDPRLKESTDRERKMRKTREGRKAYVPSEKSKREAEELYRRVTGNAIGKPKMVGSGGVTEALYSHEFSTIQEKYYGKGLATGEVQHILPKWVYEKFFDRLKKKGENFMFNQIQAEQALETVFEATLNPRSRYSRIRDYGQMYIEAEAIYMRKMGLEEATVVVPPNAELVGVSPDKKMVTMRWYDADEEAWVEEEIPIDEMPGYFDRAAEKLKIGKTDRFGNIKSKPITAKTEKKLASVASSNQKVAQELIDIVDKKPVGTVVTIYGKKQGKTEEYEMQIVKRRYMGSEVYTVKSSGRFVELRVTGAGLQIVDQKTNKILLDKGNDATW